VSDKPVKGTGLEKAVAKLDAAFAALPPAARKGWALAAYRAYPMIRQYIVDVEHVIDDSAAKKLNDGIWGVLFSLVWVLPRGKEHTIEKLAKALGSHAPTINRFVQALAEACRKTPAALDGDTDDDDSKALPAAAP
jgi:hypothetical protein